MSIITFNIEKLITLLYLFKIMYNLSIYNFFFIILTKLIILEIKW